jgi:hypothetical protein
MKIRGFGKTQTDEEARLLDDPHEVHPSKEEEEYFSLCSAMQKC